ncbi:copper homeostasis protein CutC [Vibrio sp. 10N.286.49.B3]|uniref:copper homeostasis protein CutC n=1 Tax=Vibrio sp. 10N.286.49.B3 TaxID=1880855 RepID=UPI000C83F487|nr:copper homeostasis protein CutC [Vibrio sp. 10N.286.49.B3]PMH37575.1 copper homeostasis protein CutC [Vibrio sp. 10N.286.49.B3]
MPYQVEVCIDNIESLHNAIAGGATRIELCSSLALGGLTPSYGFMRQAVKLSSVPVYAMIRPRQGDFLYDDDDIAIMLDDIDAAAKAGIDGIVFGVLTENGAIDMPLAKRIMSRANQHKLGATFHRAIDQCQDYSQAIEDIATLGCERVLTSGLASNALEGVMVLTDMVKLARGRFTIMAGAGVTADNAQYIMQQTHIHELHLSGKSTRASHMVLHSDAHMGNQELDDYLIPVTSMKKIQQLVDVMKR